jgi:hypothetical protein
MLCPLQACNMSSRGKYLSHSSKHETDELLMGFAMEVSAADSHKTPHGKLRSQTVLTSIAINHSGQFAP